jgi:hypothetical protein
MRRLHLFEFLDQPWLPGRIRAAATLYLVAAYRITPFPALWAAQVARVLEECRLNQIVDLCSGAAGPISLVMAELARLGHRPRVTLTDLYPVAGPLRQNGYADSSIRYWPEPVDAARVPPELEGLRTIFTSFHHFAPSAARAVLRDAFEQRRAICIFEATSRNRAAIAASLVIPLLVLLVTPSVRPISAFQIVFTYLVPVLPVLAFWDGIVSQLRTYSPEELHDLARDYDSPEYRWESGFLDIPSLSVKPSYLIGRPKL